MMPSLAGYIAWLGTNIPGIPAAFLAATTSSNVVDSSGNPVTDSSGGLIASSTPDSAAAAAIQVSLWVALDTVTESLNVASSTIYTLAVYNLGADRLVNYAQDLPNSTFFVGLRAQYSIGVPSVGVVSSATDNGTYATILNPEAMRTLTFADLQTLKTPWGRQYMSFAQMYGSNLWGLS
jgi:hypothetical protein